MGADDGRMLSDRRGGAALQRAAARQGPAPAPRRRRPQADRRRRAQRGRAERRRSRRLPGAHDPRPAAVRGRAGPAGRARADRPVPDHLHERHHRARPRASSTVSATCPASASRPRTGSMLARATWSGAPRPSGWSKSARNVFIAPWLRGAAALLHDARFDPFAAAGDPGAEGVNVLCMAPTEYRVIAKRAELDAAAPAAWPGRGRRGAEPRGAARLPGRHRAVEIRDGYGQTETGQLTGMPAAEAVRPGSMGRPLPGVALEIDDGELVLADPAHRPDVLRGLPRRRAGARGRALAYRRPSHARTRTATCTSRVAPTT